MILKRNDTCVIQLKQNRVQSSTRQTKHIKCGYYYVTDIIKAGDVLVTYKFTTGIYFDYQRKDLRGGPFINYQASLLATEPQAKIILYEKYNKKQMKIKLYKYTLLL